jgi:sigma-B regulation protein RsbU (phosphoserine phosphatase)
MKVRLMNHSFSSRDQGTEHTLYASRSSRRVNTLRRRELEDRLSRLQNDYAELHVALFEAAQVHRKLCAPRRLRFGDFRIANEIFAVRQLPGDFFMAQERLGGLAVSLGDVCGKGLAAGMWVPHLAGLLAMHSTTCCEPRDIVARMNLTFEQVPWMPLTSLFQARLDPITGILDYCNAGHPPAFLLRASGEIEELSTGGPLLGVFRTDCYVQEQVQLHPEDALVVYSDGIIDSTNPAGEQFGHERWQSYVRQSRAADADALLLSLLGAVQDFASGYPIQDDMSLAVLTRGNA